MASSALPTLAVGPDQGLGCFALPRVNTDLALVGPKTWDYGDAPDNTHVPGMPTWYVPAPPASPIGFFPTLAGTANSLYGTPGARHQVVNIGWLGNINAYAGPGTFPLAVLADQPPTLEADADLFPDQDPIVNLNGGTPDHDGRDDGLYPGAVGPGFGTLTFRVSTTTGVTNWYVNALIDWTFDGDWQDFDPWTGAPEWVVINMPVSVPPLTSSSFTSPPFPVGATASQPWLRITLSDTPIVLPAPGNWEGSVPPGTFDFNGDAAFKCGETEDYCGWVRVAEHRNPEWPPIYCQPKQH
jgi:hypothetical protein